MQISLTVFSRSWSQLAEAVCSSPIGQAGILLHISGRLFETIVDNPAGSIAWPSGGPFDGIAGVATSRPVEERSIQCFLYCTNLPSMYRQFNLFRAGFGPYLLVLPCALLPLIPASLGA